MLKQKTKNPDVIVPILLDSFEECKKKVLWLNEKFGFTKFCPDGLNKGHRSVGYPSREDYENEAKKFAEVREWMHGRGFSCGWFCNLSVKSGRGPFTPIIKADGSPHPFASCPLDPEFRARLSSDIAYFASIARPEFIFIEDDFSVGAANGCYCEHHLAAFAEKMGQRYEREELVKIFSETSPESLKIRRAYRELVKDSLVGMAECIRAAMDEKCPDIPVGLMQAGACDYDGDFALDVMRALAGERHTPFVRLYGTQYCGFDIKLMPKHLYHALHSISNMPSDVLCYHESDTFPHNRYYTAGKHATAMMSAAYSYGMMGSLFFAQQFLDEPFEEDAYGKAYTKERARFLTLCAIAEKCRVSGIEICYDTFYNTVEDGRPLPYFVESVSRFGIPFSATKSSVAVWDSRQAKYYPEKTVLEYLSRGLILDGDAAKILCERGFGKYLGVSVGEDVLLENDMLVYDLGAHEIIVSDEFCADGEGRKMWCAHAYSADAPHGKWLRLNNISNDATIITEGRDFRNNLITPTMTYYENELGGKVAVMSLTVKDNQSQSLFNHRRQRLLQRVVERMADEYPFVKNAPEVYNIFLTPREAGDMLALLNLINLSEDDAENVAIYLPPALRSASSFSEIGENGEIRFLDVLRTEDGIILPFPLRHASPTYIIINK